VWVKNKINRLSYSRTKSRANVVWFPSYFAYRGVSGGEIQILEHRGSSLYKYTIPDPLTLTSASCGPEFSLQSGNTGQSWHSQVGEVNYHVSVLFYKFCLTLKRRLKLSVYSCNGVKYVSFSLCVKCISYIFFLDIT